MDLIPPASHHDVLVLVLRVALLLLTARAFGEVARRFDQPAVVGEILAGVVLGPSLLSGLFPALGAWIVPQNATELHMLDEIGLVGAVFLLLMTGLETDLQLIRAYARRAVSVSIGGITVTFTSGYLLASYLPDSLLPAGSSRLIFNLFIATSMSVSAIPVVAKVLMDLGLIRRQIGQTILASGMVDDTMAWTMLSFVLGIMAAGELTWGAAGSAVGRIALFIGGSFFVGRWVMRKLLHIVQDRVGVPERILSLVVILAFTWAAISQALGLEAVLGAFMVGVLFGTLPRFPQAVVHQLEGITIAVFAPLFFASAGLKVDLRALADPEISTYAALLLSVAVVGKYIGTYAGGRLLGGADHWSAIAYGSGLNARGAVEIIIASIGLGAGIINATVYTLIVIVAVLTSVMAPFGLRWALRHVEPDADERMRLHREAIEKNSIIAQARRVLVPVRMRESSDDFARKGIESHLLSLMPEQISATLLTVVASADERAAAQTFLATLAARFRAREVETRVIESRAPSDAILREAEKGYDLMLIGAPEQTQGKETLFNPVVDRLMRFSPCTAMVIRGTAVPDWRPRHFLVPTNGTQAAQRAAETAFAIARAEPEHTRVTILHVSQPIGTDYTVDASGKLSDRQQQRASEILSHLENLGRALGVTVDGEHRFNASPEQVILDEIPRLGIDMVFVGTDARPGLERLFLGRRVERIINEASCAVVVVNVGG